MRIIQILPTFAYGDAIGNHVLSLKHQFSQRGIENEIFAEHIVERLQEFAKPIEDYTNKHDDIILYHMSTGSRLNRMIGSYAGTHVMYYHNITPPSFFEGYNSDAKKRCCDAYQDLKEIAKQFDLAVCDSKYNLLDLERYGYNCPMIALPINIPFDDYRMKPAESVLQKYNDGYTNIIFVGRIAPNKRQEKIIEDFYYYHEYYNSKSRLFLVGNYKGMERYYLRLKKYITKNRMKDVIFTGHIAFNEILAYYSIADLFLCESMHEGFCVPLVESMIFHVPVLAFDSSAIAETLGNGGIIHSNIDSRNTAKLINEILTDPKLLQDIKDNQVSEVQRFDEDNMVEQLLDFITRNL